METKNYDLLTMIDNYHMQKVDDADAPAYYITGCDYTLTLVNIANDNDFDADRVAEMLLDDIIDIIDALNNDDDDVDNEGTITDYNFNEIRFVID